jgi:hypothetical protein
MRQFSRGNKIQRVIGAIDGTYVAIAAPASQRMAYTNRKFFTSMTLQAISDHKLLFIDCFAGYPSSCHDVKVFRNSPIYEKIEANTEVLFPNGERILGDKAYPLKKCLIIPYINRGGLTRQQKYFNEKLSSARQVIERTFALYFGRFRRFKKLNMKFLEGIPATIIAGCVLHNICLLYNDTFTSEYLREGTAFLATRLVNQNEEQNEVQFIDNPAQNAKIERDLIATQLFNRRRQRR